MEYTAVFKRATGAIEAVHFTGSFDASDAWKSIGKVGQVSGRDWLIALVPGHHKIHTSASLFDEKSIDISLTKKGLPPV
jgi:hypothetical protein